MYVHVNFSFTRVLMTYGSIYDLQYTCMHENIKSTLKAGWIV